MADEPPQDPLFSSLISQAVKNLTEAREEHQNDVQDDTQIVVQDVRPLFETMREQMEGIDMNNSETMGQAIGNMFTSMFANINRIITAPVEPGVSQESQIFTSILGAEQAEQILRHVHIKTYFEEQLTTLGIKGAMLATKEKYNLPDDYELKIELIVKFDGSTKSNMPDVD